ncbi:eukaryotic translation initiation factor 4 gamma-like [Lathyrus oleraceus]|uniref:eukaryotic translation initiation factor 4 gamma-like n=1 Tax=Pisum sativum TaxID=3888 RepID=UPI0021CFEBF0|nr:eukaryotic translation initiation factor 4 gamma-like [Pisum sativum]
MYLFSKIDPPEVIAHYLQNMASQGIDISDFSMDWLPEHPPNFMKRMRDPSERKSKKKTLKIGASTLTQKLLAPLDSSAPSKSSLSEAPLPSRSKQISSSLPQPYPTYSPSEPIISIRTPSESHNFETNTSSPTLQKFDLTTTTFPVSEALLFNEPISPPSSNPLSPPYYDLSSHADHPEIPNPSSPTLAQLQDTANSEQTPGSEARLEARLVREAEEKARKEAEEKDGLEAEENARKKAEEKAMTEASAAEAEADTEEAARIAVEEVAKSTEVALTRGASSTYAIAPLVLQTLEELQKE